LRYFSEFGYLPGVLRKSSRSLSHLLMSSCYRCNQFKVIPLAYAASQYYVGLRTCGWCGLLLPTE